MEEIKSVRVKRVLQQSVTFGGVDLSGSQFDIKVTLYDDGNKKSVIGLNTDARNVWDKIEYRKRGRYSDYTDDELIRDFIDINSKREGSEFEISQDPFLEKPPKERSFGFDPYYLNNGAKILIKWLDGNFSVGGKGWSDLNGNELDIQKGQTQSTKGFIDKTAQVLASDSYEGENKILTYTSYELKPNGSPVVWRRYSDVDIINQIISFWKKKVPNYDNLALCDPNNEFCEFVDFINPADALEQSEPVQDNVLKSTDTIADDKINLSFVIDSSISIKVREDFDFKIHIGEPPVDPLLVGFDFGDSDQDLSLLDDEFIEAEFTGGENIYADIEEAKQAKKDGDDQDLDKEQIPNNTPGAGTGVVSTGSYTSELPKESDKGGPKGDYAIKYGFNNVPYYGQWDKRWRYVVYGLWTGTANEKDFVELNMVDKSVWKEIKYPKAGHGSPSNPNIETQWRNKTFKVKFDGENGENGFSSIKGGGCGITSFSMVINFWMIKLNKGIYTSPIKMAKLACDTGARASTPPPNGTSPNSTFYNKIKEVFGLKVSSCKYDEAISLVKSGTPVIMCGTWKGFRGDGNVKVQKGGHFIVITGYEASTKRFRVNDPGGANWTYYFQDTLPEKPFWKVTN